MRTGSCLTTLQGLAIVGMLIQGACGGNGTAKAGVTQDPATSNPVSISLVGAPTKVASGATVPFTAQVQGSTNTAVTWAVDGVQNGNGTVGQITGSGDTVNYIAPGLAGTHTVVATSVADPNKNVSTSISVLVTPVTLTLSPSSSSLAVSATTSFTALVSGATNTAVTWSVDAVTNGNATVGTITGSGNTITYTTPTSAGTHTVKATSVADATVSAASTVTVQALGVVSLAMTPSGPVNINASGTMSFTSSVTGSTNTAVIWSVDAITNGNATVGTITGSGGTISYKAPASAGTHTVKATSVADATKSATSTVTVQAPGVVSVAMTPTGPVNINASGITTFTASVTGSTNTAVTWSVDAVTNGNASVGTLTGSGSTVTYLAPASSGTHTVKATSVQDSSKFISASVVVGSLSIVDLGPLAAFPGCEGMGSGATGGRGGDVYTVNTLDDTTNAGCVPQNGPNGPICSLRDVMLKSGPRTAVFSVSGTIVLHEAMYPTKRGLTIAGQTAPGGGIQIRGDGTFGTGGSMLWLNGNSIVRYIRIRPGNAPVNASYQGLTGMGISMDQTDDVVVDHCSYEWDGNKAVANWSINGLRRNTFSWNIVAECLAPHSTGMLIGGDPMGQANMDISSWDGHHNVLATIDHRLPQTWFKYGRWINNYVFGYDYAMLVRGGTNFDIIGNVWDGMDSGIKADPAKNEVRWADTYAHNENQIVPGGTAQIYMNNNFGPHNPLGTLDNFTTMFRIASCENCQLDNSPVDTRFKATGPTIPSSLNTWPITITHLSTKEDLKKLLAPAAGAYRRLAPDGSWVANRDSVDARIIAYILNPTTSPTSLVTAAGPYPDLSGGTPYVDSDGDGMPDIWEDAHGLNKNDPSDRNIIRPNAHGYTNLELYLSGLFPNGTPLP